MKVNAWVCSRATDSNLESGFSEGTVILTTFSARACVLGRANRSLHSAQLVSLRVTGVEQFLSCEAND